MSGLGSGGGRAPKRSGAGKPSKGYPKVSGADDATIDIRKIQKPPAELPPSQEPANELPTDSTAPVEPVEVDTAPPELPVSPQYDAELGGGAGPLPSSPEVPNSDLDRAENVLPQTAEDLRPFDPPRPDSPDWMDIPEVNALALGAENARLPTNKRADQTKEHDGNHTGGRDVEAIEAGSGKVQPNESEGPFLSLGEGQEQFADPSNESQRRGRGKLIDPIAGPLQTENGNVRKGESQGSVPPVVAKSALGFVPVDGVGQISPGKVNRDIPTHQSETNSWGALGNGARPLREWPAEHARSKQTKADNESRVQGPSRQIRRIAPIVPVKNGKAIAGVDGGQSFSVRQKRKSSVDDQVRKSSKNGSIPASDRRKRRQNHTPVGHRAALVPRVGESSVHLLGFEISKNLGEYLNVIEQFTTTSLHPKQLEGFLPIATTTEFSRLSPEAFELHRAEFTQSVKDRLIAEWEMMTKQIWPVYEKDIPNSKGGIYRKKGTPYDAHHIIPKSYGGPHRWENLTPARSPNEHQEGIHSHPITKSLFP